MPRALNAFDAWNLKETKILPESQLLLRYERNIASKYLTQEY